MLSLQQLRSSVKKRLDGVWFCVVMSELILNGSFARDEATLDSGVNVMEVVKRYEEQLPDGTCFWFQ